jgi:pimeloyl-ACP methyl ester carboxylesterase
MEFYTWQGYRCAFEKHACEKDTHLAQLEQAASTKPTLVLIHPIGVGLSGQFWRPFIETWKQNDASRHSVVYNPDLLGCGKSDMPRRAHRPQAWAEQLAYFIEQVICSPVVLVVQGAMLPVAVKLMALPVAAQVKGLILSGPPDWQLMTTPTSPLQQTLSWRLVDSPLGNLFYRYARREKFLRSFSQRQLFEQAQDVSDSWLSMLNEGSRNMASRHAVFSFLAGFWRQDYAEAIAQIHQPTLIVMGEAASTIDRTTAKAREQANKKTGENISEKRIQDYFDHLPQAQSVIIKGRNVMPYESAPEFVSAIAPFITHL